MFDFLARLRFCIILAIIGFLLVLASFFEIKDISKFAISPLPNALYPIFIVGLFLFVMSVILFFLEKRSSRIELPKELSTIQQIIDNSIFFSAPMDTFAVKGKPEQYKDSRAQVLMVISAIKKKCEIDDIYYAGEGITDIKDFDLPGASLKEDFNRIRQREYFVLYWPNKFASRSSLVETGIALTLNKKCIFFVKESSDLPFLLQGAQNVTKSIKIIKFIDIDDLVNKVKNNGREIFNFQTIE